MRFRTKKETRHASRLFVSIGGKPRKFLIRYPEGEDRRVSLVPTSRQNRKGKYFTAKICEEVRKYLQDKSDEGRVEFDDAAEEVMEELRREYVKHRISIRRSEMLWKYRDGVPVQLPMKTTPYDHQARAFGFCHGIRNSALLAEQGTGKTFIELAVNGQRYLDGEISKLLVITTKAATYVWKKQLEEHADFPFVCQEWKSQGKNPLPMGDGLHVIVTSYDYAARNAKRLAKWKPDSVVLDESHKIQNRRSNRSRACFVIGDKAKFRSIATGTAIGNDPFTAWAQYRFLDPDLFGRGFSSFKDRYAETGGYMGLEIVGFKNLDEFSRKIHSISFRTTKAECLDLPDEIVQPIYCDPDQRTLKVYREMNLEFLSQIGDQEIAVDRRISAISKLRQITSGMLKHEGKLIPISKVKLNALSEYLEDLGQENLVVFTFFNHEMDMVGDLLREHGRSHLRLNGQTKDRAGVISAFQSFKSNGSIIVQIQTGDAGIELSAASRSVFFSPTFSLFNYLQAKARLHRIGQKKKVVHSPILMRGTVDERVALILQSSGDLSSTILDTNRDYRLQRSKRR